MDDHWTPRGRLNTGTAEDLRWLLHEMHGAVVAGIVNAGVRGPLAAVAFTPGSDPGLLWPAYAHLCSADEREGVNFHDLGAALEFWSHVDGWETGFFDIEDVVSGQEFERRQVRVWASLETAGSLDPCRYVLTELSRELADRWPSSVDCTDDFVVFPAGYTDVVFENLSQTASAEVLQLLRGRGYLPEFEQ